jgi:Sec-independent protein translocase protein TatA
MNIFGVGPLEIVLILIVGILVLGPKGMVEAGRKLGMFMRQVVTSQWWRGLQDGVSEVQNLPYRLMREAELDELDELKDLGKDILPDQKDLDPWEGTSWRGLNAKPPEFPTPDEADSEGENDIGEQEAPQES